jgi:hypothetical protein
MVFLWFSPFCFGYLFLWGSTEYYWQAKLLGAP